MRRLAVPTEKHVVLVGPNIAVVDQLREKQNIDFPVGSRSRFHSLPQSCNVGHGAGLAGLPVARSTTELFPRERPLFSHKRRGLGAADNSAIVRTPL